MRVGQIIKPEKIGNLSHSGGVITLNPSTVNIGGLQVDTDILTRTISTDVTLAANSLYYIYVVLVSGVPQLRISSNPNSLGPSGFISWKLVGAFYSDGLTPIGFGSFVNIEGSPTTNWINGGSIEITATTTAPTKGTNIIIDQNYWKRDGESIFVKMDYWQSGGSGTAGIGTYLFKLPINLRNLNLTKMPHTFHEGATVINIVDLPPTLGICHAGVSNTGHSFGRVKTYENDTTAVVLLTKPHDLLILKPISDTYFNINSPQGTSYSASYEALLTIWNNTPLKDL